MSSTCTVSVIETPYKYEYDPVEDYNDFTEPT